MMPPPPQAPQPLLPPQARRRPWYRHPLRQPVRLRHPHMARPQALRLTPGRWISRPKVLLLLLLPPRAQRPSRPPAHLLPNPRRRRLRHSPWCRTKFRFPCRAQESLLSMSSRPPSSQTRTISQSSRRVHRPCLVPPSLSAPSPPKFLDRATPTLLALTRWGTLLTCWAVMSPSPCPATSYGTPLTRSV